MRDETELGEGLQAALHTAVDAHPTPRPDVAGAISSARRRTLATRVGAGAVVAGVAAVAITSASLLRWPEPSQPAVPAATPPPSAPPSTPDPVPTGEVTPDEDASQPPTSPATPVVADLAALCRPQLEALSSYPMYEGLAGTADLALVTADRLYSPGDFVAFFFGPEHSDRGRMPVLCQLPADAAAPVDLAAQAPAALSDEGLVSFCSETLSAFASPAFDLRGGTVVSRDAEGEFVTALIEVEGSSYACHAVPQVWDIGSSVQPAALEPGAAAYEVHVHATTTGTDAKSIVDDPAVYVSGAGILPDDAASIVIRLGDEAPVTAPVEDDGSYALTVKYPGLTGIPATTVEVLDAAGEVLGTTHTP